MLWATSSYLYRITRQVSQISILKPRLYEQFSRDKYFDRLDGTANICQQFKVKCVSNDFGQQRYAKTRRGCLVRPLETWSLWTHLPPVFVTCRLHEQFFVWSPTLICHIKGNISAFNQRYLSHKNWPIFVTYNSK